MDQPDVNSRQLPTSERSSHSCGALAPGSSILGANGPGKQAAMADAAKAAEPCLGDDAALVSFPSKTVLRNRDPELLLSAMSMLELAFLQTVGRQLRKDAPDRACREGAARTHYRFEALRGRLRQEEGVVNRFLRSRQLAPMHPAKDSIHRVLRFDRSNALARAAPR